MHLDLRSDFPVSGEACLAALARIQTGTAAAFLRGLLLLAALLLAEGALAATIFAPIAPAPGDHVRDESNWRGSGRQKVVVGGLPMKDGPIDNLERSVVDFTLGPAEAGGGQDVSVRVLEQVEREDGKNKELGLDGTEWEAQRSKKGWNVSQAGGERSKRSQRKWVEAALLGLAVSEDDPLALLLPSGPVEPGSNWSIPFPRILKLLGRADVTIDESASHAQVRFLDAASLFGHDGARLEFDVRLVITGIKQGTVREGRFEARGVAHLPVGAPAPWVDLDGTMGVRFDGTVRRGLLSANLDMDMIMQWKQSRKPGG